MCACVRECVCLCVCENIFMRLKCVETHINEQEEAARLKSDRFLAVSVCACAHVRVHVHQKECERKLNVMNICFVSFACG